MNERILAFIALILGVSGLFIDGFFIFGVTFLVFWSLLISYWVYIDVDRIRKEIEYLNANISRTGSNLDAKAQTAISDGRFWICPHCNSLDETEPKVYHQSKNLEPT